MIRESRVRRNLDHIDRLLAEIACGAESAEHQAAAAETVAVFRWLRREAGRTRGDDPSVGPAAGLDSGEVNGKAP